MGGHPYHLHDPETAHTLTGVSIGDFGAAHWHALFLAIIVGAFSVPNTSHRCAHEYGLMCVWLRASACEARFHQLCSISILVARQHPHAIQPDFPLLSAEHGVQPTFLMRRASLQAHSCRKLLKALARVPSLPGILIRIGAKWEQEAIRFNMGGEGDEECQK